MGRQKNYCTINSCQRPVEGFGFCSLHYQRLKRLGTPHLTKQSEESRFWSLVDKKKKSDCWNWKGFITKYGYGQMSTNKLTSSRFAHRYSYVLHKGSIPEGMYVCHTCDNRKCVNPLHLFLGDHLENMNDMVRKGRAARGERSAHVKLKVKDVLKIRNSDLSNSELARMFSVSNATITLIKNNKNWGWLNG